MSDLPTIKVLYTCELCGLVDIGVDVPARTTEDVVAWMEGICIHAIANDHSQRSPHCRPRTLTNIKIPVTGASKLGGSSEN